MRKGVMRSLGLAVVLVVLLLMAVVAVAGRPPQSDVPNPYPEGLRNLHNSSGVKVLIVTYGYGPITGVTPWEDKDMWAAAASEFGFVVDWYNGVPTADLLLKYDLVIYTAGGYWYSLTPDVMNALRQYHYAGKPLIVVFPDLNYDWGAHPEIGDFARDVLHVEGALGLLPDYSYTVYADAGHPIALLPYKLPASVVIPPVNSWPDAFKPAAGAQGVLRQGCAYTEFGVGVSAGLPQYSYYCPTDHYAVVAYPGAPGRGRVVVFGFVPAGVPEWGKKLAKNAIAWALGIADLTIKKITPIQVVYDVDINKDGKIDLVQGKATAIMVNVTGFQNLDPNVVIEVALTFEGKTYVESKTVEELLRDERIIFYVTPSQLGDQKITAVVDPYNKIQEINETNNKAETTVTIKDTRGLSLAYYRIVGPYGAPSNEEFMDTALHNSIFIKATYPVADGELYYRTMGDVNGTTIKGFVQLDVIYLAYTNWLQNGGDRAIGIVPNNYFSYHGIYAVGISVPLSVKSAVLVTEGYWTTAAHEIGHTFGLWIKIPFISKEEYEINPPGNPARGYWVERKMDIINGICFMGYATESPRTFMYNATHHVWVDNEDYEILFKSFRIGGWFDLFDPEFRWAVTVGGLIYRNGTIRLAPLYYVENASADYPFPGNASLLVLDWGGRVIDSVNFSVWFIAFVEPLGAVEMDPAPFAFLAPFPPDAAKIVIRYGNTTVEFNPLTKLLHDAVDSIPDYGFINNPQQLRKALHNKIDAVENMLTAGNFKGALEKLKHDIKPTIEKWLKDYTTKTPLQLTKQQILHLIDQIIWRINLQTK
jgi:hypothetical protein